MLQVLFRAKDLDPEPSSHVVRGNHTQSALLTGLRKFVLYELQVLAFTRIGNGAASAPLLLERTKDDGTCRCPPPQRSRLRHVSPPASGSGRMDGWTARPTAAHPLPDVATASPLPHRQGSEGTVAAQQAVWADVISNSIPDHCSLQGRKTQTCLSHRAAGWPAAAGVGLYGPDTSLREVSVVTAAGRQARPPRRVCTAQPLLPTCPGSWRPRRSFA